MLIYRFSRVLFALVLLLGAHNASAALISRTITIDGTMSDWTSPTNILTNPGQFSTDCEGTIPPGSGGCDLDYQVQSTGRDLELFSFTWDNNNIYLFVERYASTSNATDWWFYLDTNSSGTQNDNEPVVHVDWSGSNRRTGVEICRYDAVNNTSGDPLTSGGTADGYDMPGSIVNQSCVAQYNTTGGAANGVQMEVAISWAALGLAGPANVGFHISSSNGTNIPNQLDDNMSGPGGTAQLFPPDMAITKTASAASVQAGSDITYTLLLENLLYDPFTNITVDDLLPAQFEYLSHSASAGSFVDTDGDPGSVPDQWQLASLAAGASATLTITVRALNVPVAVNTTNTATISGSTETDNDPSNDSSSAVVQVLPAPELTVTKVSSSNNINPGQSMNFTVSVSNIATVNATDVLVTDALPQFTALGLQTFAGQPFRFTDGSPASGLTLGTPEYSIDGGTTWTYTPNPGDSFDPAITHFRIPMTGTLNANGANFQVEYATRIQ